MKIGTLDLDQEVLVIAEIGNNHEGDYGLAEEMIGKAVEAGADAVKFQTFRTEHYVSPSETERFARLKGFELTYDQFERLGRHARNAGIMFLSTPFDLESARFLGGIADGIKIASSDNTFYPLIEEAAKTGKPMMVSAGLVGLDEIRTAENLIKGVWKSNGIKQDLAVLHCVSSYPVPADQANLAAIWALKNALDCTIGYSDHFIGIEAAVTAVAMGARIVEKHFTIDNAYSDYRDHQLSADPETLKRLVEKIGETTALMGHGAIGVEQCEKENALALRRSIAAAGDLAAGTVLTMDHITWLRPGDGLVPGEEHLVLGKRLARNLSGGDRVTLDALET